MSTLKKHLTSEVNHTLPTYKKLPPIHSPPPGKGTSLIKPITVARSANQSSSPSLVIDGAVIQGKQILLPKSAPGVKKAAGSQRSQKGGLVSPGNSSTRHVFKSTDLVGDKKGSEPNNVELIGYKSVDNDVKKAPALPAPTGWTPPGTELPPCKICGDKASGLHYGVYTCEACKAFFRRTLKRASLDFTCTCTEEERARGIDQPRKTTCPKCRYDRCIKVGMSKDAIKIGRYTINRKRQNDREVTILKEQGKLGPATSLSESSPGSANSNSPYSSGQSVSSPEELSTNITTLSIDETKETLTAKRMRGNDYKGDGILFRSLTNSIVMSLMENTRAATNQNAALENQHSEVSHLEKLYMQPFQPPEGVAKQPEVPPGVKFTPPKDQFKALQKSGNSNPFSVPAKGGNVQNSAVSAQNVQGFSVLGGNEIQASQTHNIISANQSTLLPGSSPNQNALNLNGTITLQIVNQGGKLVAQKAIDNQTSPIEMLLQTPSELSPMSGVHSNTDTNPSLDTMSENSPQSEPSVFDNDHDAVVPMMLNNSLPSPLTEETGYDLDNINLPFEELHVDGILSPKTNQELLNGLENDIDIAVDVEGLAEGEEGYFDIDQQLEQFDIYQELALSPGKGISMDEINSTIMDLSRTAEELDLGVRKMTCQQIMERHASYLEQYRLKTQVFGKMSISREEYIQFYNQTGIDIDNRQDIVIEALKYLEDSIAKLVKFAKAIPDFSKLDINDQVNMIKTSRFAQDMLMTGDGGTCVKNPTHEVATMPWNKDYHMEELSKVFPKDFMDWKLEYKMKIYNLDLTYDEAAICRAIMVTIPDQCPLGNREAVETIYNKLVACLCHLLAVRPPEKRPLTCARVMDVLMELVSVGRRGTQAIKEVFEIWPIANNHTLVKEVFS